MGHKRKSRLPIPSGFTACGFEQAIHSYKLAPGLAEPQGLCLLNMDGAVMGFEEHGTEAAKVFVTWLCLAYEGSPLQLKVLSELVEVQETVLEINRKDQERVRKLLEKVAADERVRVHATSTWRSVQAFLDKLREGDSVDALCADLRKIRDKLRAVKRTA